MVTRNAAALGGLGGGNVQKELTRLGQDLASTQLQNQIANLAALSRQGFQGANIGAAEIKTASGKSTGRSWPANLRGAVFISANLEDAVLSSANLRDAVFEKAKLRKADLTDAIIEDASFEGADLTKAKLPKPEAA